MATIRSESTQSFVHAGNFPVRGPDGQFEQMFEWPDLGECPKCLREGRNGHLRAVSGLTRVSAKPYEYARCDQDGRRRRVCGYTAPTEDGRLRVGPPCPECGYLTRPVCRKDGGHSLVCGAHGWFLGDPDWGIVQTPTCPICSRPMLHRERSELKGVFAWTCIPDGVTEPADVFGRLRPGP